MMVAFYATLADDPLLASYFEHLDMSAHMPKIEAFWSTLLFQTKSYSGNAFRPHLELQGLTGPHFARWVSTLEATVDARFTGPSVELMKDLAHRIALSMQMRLGVSPVA